ITAQFIPAYTKVTRSHLFDPNTGQYRLIYRSPDFVEKTGALTDPQKIVGRVLGYDKSESMAFTESDFLPPGTRPGVVAGVPPGKRAITIDASKIQGLHNLKIGDRVDILASVPVD